MDTRIDQAHHHGGDAKTPSEPARSELAVTPECESAIVSPGEPSVETPPPDSNGEQLHRQAEQLAEYLRRRQQELDHRESQLNAQAAQLESDARTARIWLGEREAEIQEQMDRRTAMEAEVRQRLDRLAAAEAAFEQRKKQADDGQAEPGVEQALSEIASISSQWGVQSQQLAFQSAEFSKLSADLESKRNRLKEREAEMIVKYRELTEVEQRSADAQAETRRLREQMIEERQNFREEVRAHRRRMAEEERRTAAELQKKREQTDQRADRVEQCRAALVRLRDELQQVHRETLEVRLATEELWAQLSGTAPPAALTRSLGRIRTQLADQYRQANAELLERKKELETIRDQLTGQYEKLIEQRRQFEDWAAGRRQDAEVQTARLIAREQELEEAESRFNEQARQWDFDRREFEQEIRRLRLQLTPHEESAKVA
jgi:chromosome segregation ATPase